MRARKRKTKKILHGWRDITEGETFTFHTQGRNDNTRHNRQYSSSTSIVPVARYIFVFFVFLILRRMGKNKA